MRKIIWGLTLLVVAAPLIAGPINPKDIAPGAKWVAHLDVQGLVGSQFGQYVLNQLREREQLDVKLQGFVAVFGFDPTKDLASITLYGQDFQPASAAVIIKSKFDKEKLLGLLRQSSGYAETPYNNHTILRWTQDQQNDAEDDRVRYGGFYNDGTALISRSEQAVKTAMDVMDGKASGTADVVPTASPGTFLLVAVKDFVLPPDTDVKAQVLKRLSGDGELRQHMESVVCVKAQVLKRLSGGVLMAGEAGGTVFANARLITRKPLDAQRVRQMLEGGLAFLSLVTEQTAEQEGQPPFWAPLLAGAQVTGGDNAVELKIAVKTQTLIDIADAAKKADEAKKTQETK